MTRVALILLGLLALAAAAAGVFTHGARHPEALSLREIGERAGEAYIYGFPLVLMDETRAAMLARPGAVQNRLIHRRELPGFGDEAVVRPNRDTLYSVAWLDLSAGPAELTWPETGGRYWLFQVMDAWTDVAGAPGSRTQGPGPGRAFITGPDWRGEPPAGAVHIVVETDTAWIIGRIAVADTAQDLDAGRALQDGFALAAPPARPLATRVVEGRPADSVASLSASAYFDRLSRLMARNRARPSDRAALQRFTGVGLVPGVYDPGGSGWLARAAAARGVQVARRRLAQAVSELPAGPTGWRTAREGLGAYGTNYNLRAGVALIGLGANKVEDAIYPTAEIDSDGRALDGGGVYRIRFAPGATPPAGAFWSLTAYDAQGFLLDTDRHALGDRDALAYEPDGSLEITIAAARPDGAQEANFLPVTAGERFMLTARLYDPAPAALSGAWTMPPVERVE